MPSISDRMLWVHARHRDTGDNQLRTMVVMRDGESLEGAMERGCIYILDTIEGGTSLTNVWSETANEFEFDAKEPLMDGQIPGGFLTQTEDR